MSDVLRDMIVNIKEEIRSCNVHIAYYQDRKAALIAQIQAMKVEAGIEVLDV